MSILVELPPDRHDPNAFADFDADSDNFNLGTARAMMWMSQLAYETHVPDTITEVARIWQLSDVKRLIQPVKLTPELTDTRGITARRGRATIVAFAGTDPLHLLNWLNDFSLGLPVSPVHEGFRAAAAAVWDDVKVAITAALADNSPIFITGHSLGAAIAVITADFARDELKLGNAQIYLYGCPRAGRDVFVTPYDDAFGKTTYRLVHGSDIVATVPPPQLRFLHVGRFLACERGTKFDADELTGDFGSNEPRADAGLVEQIINLFGGRSQPARLIDNLSIPLPPGIGDHLPDRYHAALSSVQ
ncbi:lipase family protein [Bradyrhizobium sp. Cp5.3]|uniref:lipase family protein n=1 Tax=Bradyrhizobium sp. Cp5.3 TaxID=443598 RepID=UPI0003FC2A62|nr:lipase family protein [Bradyrhizobium sp. Cp5.3]